MHKCIKFRMVGRAVECGGLENRWGCKPSGGSNPSPSASDKQYCKNLQNFSKSPAELRGFCYFTDSDKPAIAAQSVVPHTLSKIPMPVYIAFYRNLWYNNRQEQRRHLSPFFIVPPRAGVLYLPKGITNENTRIFAAAAVVARIYG